MILLTGATGLIGSALLRRLLEAGMEVRCLVRDPRRLGPNRVRVQITLGDLAAATAIRQAMRGVRTVIHLAATVRDQPGGSIEEINGVATARLLREAERGQVERFVHFGALGAAPAARTRFMRSKALAERAVLAADLDSVVLAPSLAFAPGDRWLTVLRRMTHLPWMAVPGSGRSHYQPIWAEDVAGCAAAVVAAGAPGGRRRLELAGPDTLSYDEMVRLALEAWGRPRPLLHVPAGLSRSMLQGLERLAGQGAFATWDEAELLLVSMSTRRGTEDARRLGVEPKPMREVLGLQPS